MKPSSLRSSPRRLGLFIATLLLPVLLSSCITSALWSSDDEDTTWGQQQDDGDTWGEFLGKLALTPFTLALDCVTLGVQAWLFGDHDDDDEPRRQNCCHRR